MSIEAFKIINMHDCKWTLKLGSKRKKEDVRKCDMGVA